MLKNESKWIQNILEEDLTSDDFPLLNIGSSSLAFREGVQPHIGQLFSNIESNGNKIIHTDIKNEEGVDIVGDLMDETFRDELSNLGVKSILCSNLLEHLRDPSAFSTSIVSTLKKGGKIIVTVPRSFPYHKDPIDTMLRPTAEELHSLFPDTEIIKEKEIFDDRCYLDDLKESKKYLFIMIIRWMMPFYKFSDWKWMIKDLFRLKKKYSVTALLLRKL